MSATFKIYREDRVLLCNDYAWPKMEAQGWSKHEPTDTDPAPADDSEQE